MTESQLHRSRPTGDGDGEGTPAPAPVPAAAQDYSQVLADIDDILEENALTFVQGFVQEGGE